MDEITKLILKEFISQIVKPVPTIDFQWNIQERESILMETLRSVIRNKDDMIHKKLWELITQDMVDSAVDTWIRKEMKDDWNRKNLENKFISIHSDRLTSEVAKKLWVLANGKTVSVKFE